MRKTDKKQPGQLKRAGKSGLPVLNPDAAGIDVGAREHYVAVPADRASQPVKVLERSRKIYIAWPSGSCSAA